MHLKRLELIGFKSFADKTTVTFDRGVTCVVGPNGCGKSNISDSIRWVLGERSAKMLRGSKMEDVIFNGTDFRKPVAYAEVSLTIDNTDKGLPIDYAEVTISRRLHRSGESEYLINKTNVRLKDVQDLILDTGIGSNSYSMIEQGRIDYVLNADPEKRRFLIEEAAGISKYKVKKEEAIRKLERTEQNMLRLNDIVQEVHKNIQYAERQAKRAEKFKEKFEYLKDLEIRKAFFDISALEQEKSKLSAKKAGQQTELEKLNQEKESIKKSLDEQQSHLNSLLQRFSEQEAKRYNLRSEIDKNDQRLRFHQEKKVEYATRRGEIQQEQTQLNERIKKHEEELINKKSEQEKFSHEKSTMMDQLGAAESRLNETQQKLDRVRGLVEKSKTEAFDLSSEISKIKNEYHRLLAYLETSSEQQQKIDTNLQRFSDEKAQWLSKGEGYKNDLASLTESLSSIRMRESAVLENIKTLKESFEESERAKHDFDKILHEKQARFEMLKGLDEASGLDKESLFEKHPHLQQRLIQSIRDVVKIREGYEWTLELILGSYAKSLVAESAEDAETLFSSIAENKNIDLGVLVHHFGSNSYSEAGNERPSHPLIKGSLYEFVEIKPGYETLFSPFFRDVYVVDNFNPSEFKQLLSMTDKFRFVTAEGICLGPRGRISFKMGVNHDQSVFGRGNEMKSLTDEITRVKSQLQELTETRAQIKASIFTKEEEMELIQNQKTEYRIKIEAFESAENELAERLKSFDKECELLRSDQAEIEKQQSASKSQKELVETQLEELTKKERDHREHEGRLFKESDEHEAERNTLLKEFAGTKARYQHLQEQEILFNESISFLLEGQEADNKRVQSLIDELTRIADKERDLNAQDEKIHAEQAVNEDKLRQADVSLEVLSTEKAESQSSIQNMQEQVQTISEKQQNLQDIMHQDEMQMMDFGYKEKTISERMNQTYHVKLEELDRQNFPWEREDLEAAEEEMEKLRGKVESMGTVNLLAIEEYEELKTRYDFLMGQVKDMEDARTALLEAIRKINKTTKSLFEDTFNAVQKQFQEYYQELFHGGEAKLILVDETHPLESGIDIVVRPPGKRPQHISLLSGGEKALTAIALLFALFTVKPSPFCVLDEVDAPLDEANIDRFLTVLRTFLEKSQFIIITHNRKTIAMGDGLYGVTMQEAGVSKIVSVRVGDEDELPVDTESKSPEGEDKVENSVVA